MPSQITRRAALAGLACAFVSPVRAANVAKLGSREILTFSDGGLMLPAGMLARDRAPDELAKVLKAANLPADVSRAPINVTAVKDGDSYTFLDCGSGARFMDSAGKLGASLEAADIDRDKVTRVLFTHAHPDHLWGAVDEFDEPFFPNARYMMPEAERDFWLSEEALKKVPEAMQMFVAGARRVIKQLGDKLSTFKPGAEVASGIAAFETGGHTPGHVSFEVRGGNESVIVLGDALTHPLISFQHPQWMPASDFDGARAAATRGKVLDRLASEKLRCIGYHLPGTGAGRVERKDGTFRFVSM